MSLPKSTTKIPKSTTEQMKLSQIEESRRLATKRVLFGMRWDSREDSRAMEDHARECRHIIRESERKW